MAEIIVPKMNEAQSLAFIECAGAECIATLRQSSISRFTRPPVNEDALNAAILNSTMIGFPAGMSRRYKTIIKRTYLFADLTAQQKFPRKEDAIRRWEFMLRGMSAMGWANFGNPTIESNTSSSGLTMDNIVLDIAEAALGGIAGGAAEVMKVAAAKSIEGLKGNKEALKLYERNGQQAKGASFGLATCQQDQDGDVWLVLGAIRYLVDSGNTKVLFFDKTHAGSEVYQSKAVFTIHEEDYTARKEAAANKFYEALNASLELEFGI